MNPKETLFGPWGRIEHRTPSALFVAELPTHPKPDIKITPEMFKSEPNEISEMLNRKVQATIKLDMAIRTLEHGHKLLTEAAPEFKSLTLLGLRDCVGRNIEILKGYLK